MQSLTTRRTKSGQFAPGSSGNPGGRPKDESRVTELARSYASEAVETLVHLMRHARNERVRGTAAQALLDRGWGKPKVEVVADGTGSYIEALSLINEQITTDPLATWERSPPLRSRPTPVLIYFISMHPNIT